MDTPSRRQLLSVVAATGAGLIAGCNEEERSTPQSTFTKQFTPVETPSPENCTASRPTPNPLDGYPAAENYPDIPEPIDIQAAIDFARQHERAYVYNEMLKRLQDDEDCVQQIDITITGTTFSQNAQTFTGEVTTQPSYTTGECDGTPTATQTAITTSEVTGTYYITEQLVMRNGSPVICPQSE